MVTALNSSRLSISVPPASTARRTDLVKVTVQANDPGMKAVATPFGFKLSGRATNNGIIGSTLQLGFGRKHVSVAMNLGDTPATVLARLANARGLFRR